MGQCLKQGESAWEKRPWCEKAAPKRPPENEKRDHVSNCKRRIVRDRIGDGLRLVRGLTHQAVFLSSSCSYEEVQSITPCARRQARSETVSQAPSEEWRPEAAREAQGACWHRGRRRARQRDAQSLRLVSYLSASPWLAAIYQTQRHAAATVNVLFADFSRWCRDRACLENAAEARAMRVLFPHLGPISARARPPSLPEGVAGSARSLCCSCVLLCARRVRRTVLGPSFTRTQHASCTSKGCTGLFHQDERERLAHSFAAAAAVAGETERERALRLPLPAPNAPASAGQNESNPACAQNVPRGTLSLY